MESARKERDQDLRPHGRGGPTILVTHAQDEALMLSDRVAVMNHGKIEQIGAPEELYRRPGTRFVAEFLGRSNLVRVRCSAVRIHIEGPADAGLGRGGTGAADAGSRRALAMVRPEHVRLHPIGAAPNDQCYTGQVEEVHYFGHTRIVRIQLDVCASIEALVLSGEGRELVADSRVLIEIPRAAFHVISGDGTNSFSGLSEIAGGDDPAPDQRTR